MEPVRKLTLADYRRDWVEMGCFQEYSRRIGGGPYRPVLHVHYRLLHGFPLFGAPNDFLVWVYMDTSQTKFFWGY
jgi:hypothetical protein